MSSLSGGIMDRFTIPTARSAVSPIHPLPRPAHRFASHVVMNGVDLKTVQELLGHSTITMTMRYSHLGSTHKRKAVKVLDSVFSTDRKTAQCQNSRKIPAAKSFVSNVRGVAQPG
jgi:site-specific recombinase XerC